MSMLDVNHLTVRYGSLTILSNVSFSVSAGQWLMIVGPNGAGKSTIVNAISQSTPYTGHVCIDGINAAKYKPNILAKHLGVLTQSHFVGYAFTVEEIVRLGRYAYRPGIFDTISDEDAGIVENALELTGMKELRSQSVLTLSGGELQRTFLAQLFAQNPKLLILDEPTNHLDLVYQKQTFELIRQWLKIPGRAVISVVHDLSLARAYGTDALLLNHGHTAAVGSVSDVLNEDNLHAVYSMDVYGWMRDMLSQWS
ncbi:MAG: ABC transporter ATP-binding protein [Clostridia bacterium]